jgi:hypothetical protein
VSSGSASATKMLADAKVRRQKRILAVGSVILLALLGFQLPKLLGGGEGEAQTAVPPPAATAPGAVTLPPGKLPDTDDVFSGESQPDRLLSFGLFKSKDPFVQQLSTSPAVPAPTPVPAPSTPSALPRTGSRPRTSAPVVSGPAPTTTTTLPASPPLAPTPTPIPAPGPTGTAPTSTEPTPTTTQPAAPPPVPTSAAIATNGACENVAVNGTFPSGQGIFRLVSIARDGKSAKIGVVGGAFDSGQPVAALKLGEKLTLVNTADGTRYVIVLQSRCETTTSAPVTSTTTTTTATSTVPPPAPVPTPTTPIVTDPLDTNTPTGSP